MKNGNLNVCMCTRVGYRTDSVQFKVEETFSLYYMMFSRCLILRTSDP